VLVYGIYYKNVVMLNWCVFFFCLCVKMDEKNFSED
jgi:hypothetical protein